MNEKDYKINEIHKKITKNKQTIESVKFDTAMSESYVLSHQKQLIRLAKEYKLRDTELKTRLQRHINNTKRLHNALDKLIKEKEALHIELREAHNFGKTQCEYCERYFTPQGIKRHSDTCASKPEIKMEVEHIEEVKELKGDLAAKKAALNKKHKEELENLEKMAAEKTNSEKRPGPEPEPEKTME